VARTAIFNEDYELLSLRDPGVRPAPQSSVGYVKLSDAIEPELGNLEASLRPSESRERLMQDLRECYQPGVTWGNAFGRFLARLFSRWGVVLLDALDDSLHRLGRKVYQQAIGRAADLRSKLQARSQELIRAGYHAQVHVGEDSTLLFVAQEGNRVALRQRDHEFLAGDTGRLSAEGLEARLDDRPLDFSPNALLRPLVQDTLLPTIAYITGPSELAYHGQAQVLYSEFGRPQPILFPRGAFTLVDPRTRKLLNKYKLGVEDVWQGEDHLRLKIAAAGLGEGWAERFDRAEQDFRALLERLRSDVEKIDVTLLDPLNHAQEKMRYHLARLRDKVSRAALQRSESLARHEQLLLRFITPHTELQEREVSGAYFLGRAGYELLDRLLAQIQTRSSDHQVLDYTLVPPAS
jgi:bacillithiol synthase